MDLKIFADTIEQSAKDQIDRLLEIPVFSDCKVRIMPDVHAGAGCVIGFTANLGERVIPNIVGVDIGCGMLTVPMGKVNLDYDKLDSVIRKHVPSGMNVHAEPVAEFSLRQLFCYNDLQNVDRLERSMGTLGGGNHFIEIDEDAEGGKYLVIHTGSRNLGKQVAECWQKQAVDACENKQWYEDAREKLICQMKKLGMKKELAEQLMALKKLHGLLYPDIPKELCYLEGQLRNCYLYDMYVCQNWAHWNRYHIAKEILFWMGNKWALTGSFETVHNYIDMESNIVRKGAISAKKGERVLIPMNMRDGCIIGIGKGNEDWNCSAPHGAGRIMSRSQAKAELKVEDYAESMNGIYTTCVCEDTIDESPMAYKPAEEILRLIEPTVEVEKIIRPVYNFKAKE